MPYIETTHKKLRKIESGSIEDWSVHYNQTMDLLDRAVIEVALNAMDDFVVGDLVLIKVDSSTNKSASKVDDTISDDDLIGVALTNASSNTKVQVALAGVVDLPTFNFAASDKFVYLLVDDGVSSITTTETNRKIGSVLSANSFYLDSNIPKTDNSEIEIEGDRGIAVTKDGEKLQIANIFGTRANTVCQGNDPRIHYPNRDSSTTSASFVMNSTSSAPLLLRSRELTAPRSIDFPDSSTTLLGANFNLSDLQNNNLARKNLGLGDESEVTFKSVTVNNIDAKTSGGQLVINELPITAGGFELGDDKQGDLYYRNSDGKLTRIEIGNANQVLSVNDDGTGYEWQSIEPNSTLKIESKGLIIENSQARPDKKIEIAIDRLRLPGSSNSYLSLENINKTVDIDLLNFDDMDLSNPLFQYIWVVANDSSSVDTILSATSDYDSIINEYKYRGQIGLIYLIDELEFPQYIKRSNRVFISSLPLLNNKTGSRTTRVDLEFPSTIEYLNFKWEIVSGEGKFVFALNEGSIENPIVEIDNIDDENRTGEMTIPLNNSKSFYYKRVEGSVRLNLHFIGWQEES